MATQSAFQVTGSNSAALFTLKLHRGDGMTLLAMNWKGAQPPNDFVGFAIEYREPKGDRFFTLKNRLAFTKVDDTLNPAMLSTRLSPIQKFRWVHFPRNAELDGLFRYRVTPVFMNATDELSYGESQEANIALQRDTYPGKLNVCFTRGFVSSQAFVERYESRGPISTLLPDKADDGLTFKPTHSLAKDALNWMGFEARQAILDVLDEAIADKKAQVRVIAYDLNEPEIVTRLEKLKGRLKVIIDDSGKHGRPSSPESQAAKRLRVSAGRGNVKREHMSQLQHNKTIVVDGPSAQSVVCGSTNYTWRGFFVQANNAIVLNGKKPVQAFAAAFSDYWANTTAKNFGTTASAPWNGLGLSGIDAKVAFSPHSASNAALASIGTDIETKTTSSLLYSLAFLFETSGAIRDAVDKVTESNDVFVYGISDKKVGGIDVQKPDGNVQPVFPSQLGAHLPEPFKSEPTGGGGTRMHHKFVVIDFDKPTARVYMGSYNFSPTADTKNGENLLLIKDRRVAVSYMIEAVRLFDHYHFRVTQNEAATAVKELTLKKPPRKPGEKPWWSESYVDKHKIRDRELFA
jgi:phosphatidylserine/phosphatidylglycerophosphate/cardiolipin synthase-like enzyme